MELIAAVVLWLVAIPALVSCLYLLVLTCLSGQVPLPSRSKRRMRFDVIIPAHNEEAVIAHVVRSIQAVDWPTDGFRVHVVADNCTDQTAEIATATGAYVLERFDQDKRGKGYALQAAFQMSRAQAWADAVVVVDADAEVSGNFLEAIASRMEQGVQAVQVHYGVSNTNSSWRTRLLSIAKAAFHIVRSRARERLGVSCGIRGNGWAVRHTVLNAVPYAAFSLTEDVEYGIMLGMNGYRVAYADEAYSNAEMVSGEKESRSQRARWETGRFQLIRERTVPLLRQAWRTRSLLMLDLALDLMVLPLSYVVVNCAVLIVISVLILAFIDAGLGYTGLWIGIGCVLAVALHILRGWQLSGTGKQGLIDLARAPGFMLWKLALMFRKPAGKEWVRTKRESS